MDNTEDYKIPDWDEKDAKDMMPPADDAWRSMEQLLDKEMPIKTDPGNPKINGQADIGKWLLLLAGIILVSVLFLMRRSSDISTDKEQENRQVERQSIPESTQKNTENLESDMDEKNNEAEETLQSINDKNQPGTSNLPGNTSAQQQTQNKEQVNDATHSAIAKTNAAPLKNNNDLKVEQQQNKAKNNRDKKATFSSKQGKEIVISNQPSENISSDQLKSKKNKKNGVDLKQGKDGKKNILVNPGANEQLKEAVDNTNGSNSNSSQPVTNKHTLPKNNTSNTGNNIPDSVQKNKIENNFVSEEKNDSGQTIKNNIVFPGDDTITNNLQVAEERKKFTNPFNAVTLSDSNKNTVNSSVVKPPKTKNKDIKSNSKLKTGQGNLMQNGGNIRWLYGLQINPSLPLQSSDYYTASTDGSKGSIVNQFFPGAFLGIRLAGKNKMPSRSQFMLDINPFFGETIPGTLFLQTADSTRETLDSGLVKITRNNSQSSFVKISAVNAGISWQYFINSHFTAGISLRGNFVTSALVNNVSSSLSLLNSNGFDSVLNRTTSDSLYKATNADRNLLRSSQFWLMPEFVYHTKAWQFGLRGGLPLNSLNKSPLATRNYPFQAQLFIRFNLGYKRK